MIRCGIRISVCHCLNCQRRTGSPFSAQARFPEDKVVLSGETRSYTHRGGSGGRATFLSCPDCGSTIAYEIESLPGLIAIPLGAFADPDFPPPRFSVWEKRKHPWVHITGDQVDRHP